MLSNLTRANSVKQFPVVEYRKGTEWAGIISVVSLFLAYDIGAQWSCPIPKT